MFDPTYFSADYEIVQGREDPPSEEPSDDENGPWIREGVIHSRKPNH